MARLRRDFANNTEPNGSVAWFARWIGRPSLAAIVNCPTPWGARMVEITAEPDTFFSQPATCRVRGTRVTGFVTYEPDAGWTFHAYVRFLAFCRRINVDNGD